MDDYALVVGDQEVSQLAAALMLSSHVLGSSPGFLTAQLCGHLMEEDGPAIAELLKSLRRADPAAFIPIRNGYLNGPGALLRTIPTGSRVTTVAALADGWRALSGSRDWTLRLWDLESGTELRGFEGHTDGVMTVALLADGRRALSGSDDRTLRLWDLESGAGVACFVGDNGITSLTMWAASYSGLSMSAM